jgi:hypothetical protein
MSKYNPLFIRSLPIGAASGHTFFRNFEVKTQESKIDHQEEI